MNLPTNFNDPSRLPNQLVIKNGRIVEKATGKPPRFPKEKDGVVFEGMEVNVVPHWDLVLILGRSKQRRELIRTIQELISNY